MTTAGAPPAPRLAVTGTDTAVGKTVVTCALLAACRARGRRVPGMKPVETGVSADDAHTDAARIRRAAGDVDDPTLVCPQTLAEPLAPMVAAARAGTTVDLARLDDAFARLTRGADGVVVEGAGGLLVPFTRDATLVDLALRWELALVVVAANRLGVLNHALLTVREAERRGVRVRAVVLNAVHGGAPDVAQRTNADALRALLPHVPVVELAHAPDPSDLEAAARAGAQLLDLLG
jgi:dethiobiotin synthetase